MTELGAPHGIVGEFVKVGGTYMGEASRYKVIVDRISHEVDYYRAFLKHAMLNGTYVINNPFWWTADDKFFNYSVVQKLGVTVPKTVLLPQKGYPWDVDIQQESLRNLDYPLDWDAILDVLERRARRAHVSVGRMARAYCAVHRATTPTTPSASCCSGRK